MVKVILNNESILLDETLSVLDALNKVGIELPNFCHDSRLDKNFGICGLCTININGILKKACQTQVSEGLILNTETDDVINFRKNLLQDYIDNHHENCLICPKTGDCRLQKYCFQYEIVKKKATENLLPIDDSNPFYYIDSNKCVACGRCFQICANLQCNHAIKMGITDNRRHSIFDQTKCVSCGNCVSKCPTGALMPKSKVKFRVCDTEKTNSTCIYCGVGCQIEFRTMNGQVVGATPRDIAPNRGLLCVKGKFGFSFINHKNRLKTPLIRKDGVLVEATWEEAYTLISNKFKEIKKEFGADAIGGFSSAKCTNEENYLFQKFMRVAIGTNNIDHCARFCHSTTGSGLGLSLGIGAMSNSIGEIIDNKTIFMLGSNARETHPVIGTMIKRAKQRGAKLVIVDPRKIDMSEIADYFLQINLKSNSALLNGMINVIITEKLYNKEFVLKNTERFDELVESSKKYTPEYVAEICGISTENIRDVARLYASGPTATYFTMGVTQHTNGTYEVQEIATLALLCGNLGIENTGLNPLRGQNNVQGAGDMGAYPNKYPGNKKVDDIENIRYFENFWGVKLNRQIGKFGPAMIEAAKNGDIKALYIMGENPMLSDADLNQVKIALSKVDFLVVQDLFLTETTEFADVVLPACSFAEKDGTFTNTERRIQRVRKAIKTIGDSKPDYEILLNLFKYMDLPQNYSTPEDITIEISKIIENYSGLNYSLIENEGIQWPIVNNLGTDILYKNGIKRGKGLLFESDDIVSGENKTQNYPYLLTTGRVLYQYHTRTLSGKVDGLNEKSPHSFIEINPVTATKLSISDGDRVKVISLRGEIETYANITDKVKEDIFFMPFHFIDGAPNYLTDASHLDSVAHMPEFKTIAVNIQKI